MLIFERMVSGRWIVLFLLLSNQLHAQNSMSDSVIGNDNQQKARNYYFSQRGEELALYNGTQREEYSMDFKGHAYFQSTDWRIGSVKFGHVLYDSVLMRYDLYTDQVIVKLKGTGGISFA